jgi:hypothetical protein
MFPEVQMRSIILPRVHASIDQKLMSASATLALGLMCIAGWANSTPSGGTYPVWFALRCLFSEFRASRPLARHAPHVPRASAILRVLSFGDLELCVAKVNPPRLHVPAVNSKVSD